MQIERRATDKPTPTNLNLRRRGEETDSNRIIMSDYSSRIVLKLCKAPSHQRGRRMGQSDDTGLLLWVAVLRNK